MNHLPDTEQRLPDQRVIQTLMDTLDGWWEWHIPSGDMTFSPQMELTLGYAPGEMQPVLETWSHSVHTEDTHRVFELVRQHLTGVRARYDVKYRLRNRHGHYLWVRDRGRICERDERGEPLRMVGLIQDITDDVNLELQLMVQAKYDKLTGLRNRHECESVFKNMLHTCKRLKVPLGVCLFDLDHFKRINDSHGHLVGDEVLLQVATVVAQRVRASDAVFRWGGEEFLLLCPGTDSQQTSFFARELCRSIESLDWKQVAPGLHVTASFGVTAMVPDGTRPHETAVTQQALVLAADSALYKAKAQGRNRVVICGHDDPQLVEPKG